MQMPSCFAVLVTCAAVIAQEPTGGARPGTQQTAEPLPAPPPAAGAQGPGGPPGQPSGPAAQHPDDLAAIPIPTDGEGGTPLPITLSEALRLGDTNNTSLRANELLPQQAGQDVRAARSIFEPEVYGDATVSRSRDPARNIFQPAISRESYSGRFGLRQLVPSGGLLDLSYAPTRLEQTTSIAGFPSKQFSSDLTATYRQPLLRGAWSDYTLRNVHIQESVRAAAELRFERLRQDTLLSVVEAYWGYVFARENYRVAFRALELALSQLGRTNERIRVGELAVLDRVVDEAEVARRREELVTAENEIRGREDALRRLLFDDGDGELWRRQLEPVTPIGEFGATPALDWRDLARAARRLRPDLRALRADASIAETQLDAAARDMLPKLDVVATYTTDSVRNSFSDAWDDTVGLDYVDWSVALELSVPIGNSAARAAHDRARLEVERTHRVLYDAEIGVAAEVRDAVRQLRTLGESIERGRESVRLAETNLDREVARKEAGSSTTFEVQQRNQELQEAQSRLLRNQLDYRIAEANLLHVQGVLQVDHASAGEEPR